MFVSCAPTSPLLTSSFSITALGALPFNDEERPRMLLDDGLALSQIVFAQLPDFRDDGIRLFERILLINLCQHIACDKNTHDSG